MASTRLVSCDATIISVDAGNVVALARGCTIRASREMIDCSVPLDSAAVRRQCRIDFEVQVEKLIAATQTFGTIFLDGGDIIFSADTPGSTFYGVTLAANWETTWGDPDTESLTLQCSDGQAPTLT